jgi:hypothetical protein
MEDKSVGEHTGSRITFGGSTSHLGVEEDEEEMDLQGFDVLWEDLYFNGAISDVD